MRLGFIAFTFAAVTCSALASDLQVTTTRKLANTSQNHQHFNSTKTGRVNPGVESKRVEEVFYIVNVANRSFSAKPALEARYILFVERQRLGEKKGEEKIERVSGTATLEAIPTKGTINFDTTSVDLAEETLSGNWIYKNGGRMKATDKVLGIWIKFFDGDKEVGEYVNPTTLKRHKWNE